MDPLIQHLEQGAVVLTPNRRLARHLQWQFAEAQQRQGKRLWPTPAIYPWGSWLERLWDGHAQARALAGEMPELLLDEAQAQRLWEQILEQSAHTEGLLQRSAAAATVRRAWEAWQAWRTPPISDNGSPDVQAFIAWSGEYRRRCRAQRWLDRALLGTRLAELCGAGGLPLPPRLLLIGFDQFTPQQQWLLEEAAANGSRWERWEPPTEQGPAQVAALADAEAEIATVADWAAAQLLENPRQSIGIVVPELSKHRDNLRRALDARLRPAALLGLPAGKAPYNISLGRPLAEQSMIFDALQLLRLLLGPMPLEELSRLLRSPFIAGTDDEWPQRAALDLLLRRRSEVRVSLKRLAYLAAQPEPGAGEEGSSRCPQLAERLQGWLEQAERLPRRQTLAAWMRSFAQLLNLVGWPGAEQGNSDSRYLLEAWSQLLGRFAGLELTEGAVSASEALALLRRLAVETPFQGLGPELAPIQVLGMLEAAGLSFDRLWVMGLDDEHWPPAPQPNPFLPHELQRSLGMPHADADRELAFARRLTERLRALCRGDAPACFSYPLNDGERQLRPSPLLAGLPPMPAAAIPESRLLPEAELFRSAALERFVDEAGPPLAAGAVEGGATLIRDQSHCPFRAFARHRLGADEPAVVSPGLDAAERGSLLHRALELCWQRLDGHAALIALDPPALLALCEAVADEVLASESRRRPHTFSQRFTALEHRRLSRLCLEWLELEAQRPPFTVEACEQADSVDLGGLQLRTRIDRIDRDADGDRLLIDYKTGRPATGHWLGERPDEPQLPLYAISLQPPPAALLFAVLRHGEMGFRGIAEASGLLPGVKGAEELKDEGGLPLDWAQLLDSWRRILEGLANDFRSGHAAVDPKGPASCDYCGLQLFCRIAGQEGEVEPAHHHRGEGEDG